jgi:4-aminobutyrate aminotransferase
MDCLGAQSISTFGGNPLSTAAAKATLDYVLEHDLQQQALRVGTLLREGLEKATAQLQMVGDVRGKGLMIGVELVRPGTTEPDAAAAAAVMERAREGGLLIGKGGLYGNCLRVAPPLTLTEDEAREGLAILTDALQTVGDAR